MIVPEKMRKCCHVIIVLFLFGLLSCGTNSENQLDNPTRGSVKLAVDESFQPLVSELVMSYEGIYPNTHFNVRYIPEQEAILAFLQDSVRQAFVTRELTASEEEIIKKQQGIYKKQEIATDGIALIISEQNKDSLITLTELQSVFNKSVKNWEELPGRKSSGPIILVFDNANSSNLHFLLNKFGVEDLTGLSIFTSGSNEKVFEFIKQNPNAIGFVGVNWISDDNSSLAHELSRGIKVMGVGNQEENIGNTVYFQPFFRQLVDKKYPLSRSVYILSREGYSGLGGGLQTYIARDVGGLIIEKKGLVPTIPYPRSIELRPDNLK